jgi:hypothetical protein
MPQNSAEPAPALPSQLNRDVEASDKPVPNDPDAKGRVMIRGALRFEVSTSSVDLEAGRLVSVFVKIMNPFDTPVRIRNVTCITPVEFIDVGQKRREKALRELRESSLGLKEAIRVTPRRLVRWLVRWSRPKDEKLADQPGIEMATASTNVVESKAILAPIPSPNNPAPAKITDNDDFMKRIKQAELAAAILQPGDSGIQTFTLCTQSWLLFQPASYALPIFIDYEIDGIVHLDTVKYSLNIRSPFRAIICGAMLGSLAGFILHDISVDKRIENMIKQPLLGWAFWGWLLLFFLTAIGSILAAILTVIAFARKRDAQPFITVEDFWGGIFVGTVIGYGGKSILEQLLSTNGTTLQTVVGPSGTK